MSPSISAKNRIKRARELIQQVRDLPVPHEGGRSNFSYILEVKATLKEARELVQLIPKRVGVKPEMKAEVQAIFDEAAKADKELLSISLR